MKTVLAALLLVWIASGQISEEELRPKIVVFRYPPLARAARVQGDVVLTVDPGGITVVSGPPLLRQAAIENAKSLGMPKSATLIYRFVLFPSTTVPASMSEKKGDAFDRFFLRIFGLETERVVRYDRCVEGVAPPNEVRISQAMIEILVNAGAMCPIID